MVGVEGPTSVTCEVGGPIGSAAGPSRTHTLSIGHVCLHVFRCISLTLCRVATCGEVQMVIKGQKHLRPQVLSRELSLLLESRRPLED